MQDGAVDIIRLGREVLPLPIVVEERRERRGPEPEHRAQGRDRLLVVVHRHGDPHLGQELAGPHEVGPPPEGRDREVVRVIGRGGHEHAQARLQIEGRNDVRHELPGGKEVLEALDGESIALAVEGELSDLLVVDEADEIVVHNGVLEPDEERRHVPPPVLDEADIHVEGQVLAGPSHLLGLLLAPDREYEIAPLRHVPDVGQHVIQQVHVVEVGHQGHPRVTGLGDDGAGRKDVGELEVLHQIRHVHGAQGVVPDEVRIEIRVIAEVLVKVLRRIADGLVEDVLVVVEEGASLEDRAALLLDEPLGGEEDGLIRVPLEILGVDVDVGGEAEALEALGEGRLMHADRLGVTGDLGHLVPVLLERPARDEGTAVGVEMRLDVTGYVALRSGPERVEVDLVEPGDPPEVDVPPGHLGVHLGEGVHRPHDRGVEQNDLVEFGQALPAVGLHGRLVRPDVEADVLAQNDLVGEAGQFRVALRGQIPVDDDGEL